MRWMQRIYEQWKRGKIFRANSGQLTQGMLPNAVEEILGRSDQITHYDELTESWCEWRYSSATGKRKDFVLLFIQGSLQSWYTESGDGTRVIELRAKIKKW